MENEVWLHLFCVLACLIGCLFLWLLVCSKKYTYMPFKRKWNSLIKNVQHFQQYIPSMSNNFIINPITMQHEQHSCLDFSSTYENVWIFASKYRRLLSGQGIDSTSYSVIHPPGCYDCVRTNRPLIIVCELLAVWYRKWMTDCLIFFLFFFSACRISHRQQCRSERSE